MPDAFPMYVLYIYNCTPTYTKLNTQIFKLAPSRVHCQTENRKLNLLEEKQKTINLRPINLFRYMCVCVCISLCVFVAINY